MPNFDTMEFRFTPKPLMDDPKEIEKGLALKERKIDCWRADPNDFIDETTKGYTASEVKRDLREVELLKSVWKEENTPETKRLKQVAELYEGVVIEGIEGSEWLGDGWDVFVTTEYDDYKNGIDAVMVRTADEEGATDEYIGLAFDVTFTGQTRELERKLHSIQMLIDKNKLPSVKYFQDADGNPHKSPLVLPKIVLGSRYATAEKLIRLWMSDDPQKNKKLASDPIQSKLLLETLFQLRFFYEYANRPNEHGRPKNEEAAALYAAAYNTFFEIYQERQAQVAKDFAEISDDVVFDTIRKYTKNDD